MSINVTITLPIPTATAVQQGDFDKAALSQLIVDAVKALPLLGGPSYASATPPFEQEEGALTPPAMSTYDAEVVTIRGGHASRASSPPMYTPNPTEYDVSQPSFSATEGEVVRHPETDFKVDKFPVTVMHEGKGVHPIHVNSAMTGGEVMVLIEQKTGVEIGKQRVRCELEKKAGNVGLEVEKTLHATGIRRHRQLHLTQLSGICFLDSYLDFWVHVKGCVSERKVPVHAKFTTTTLEMGMALFEHFAPWAPFGRRQVRFKGMVVFGDGGSEVARTMQEIGVKQGCFVQFEMVVFPA